MSKGPHKVQFHIDTTTEACFGAKYNYLTVVGFAPRKNNCQMLRFRCDCGNYITASAFNWKSGRTKSCGCKTSELLSSALLRLEHTPSLDRLRRIYRGMKERCYNPNIDNYKNYGAREITICDEWLNDRDAFISWALSNGYRDDLSIDRIDVNGNYEPGNCRWATAIVQRNNQRPRTTPSKRKVMFTIDGVTKSGIEWCEEYGVSMQFVTYRIRKKGMTPLEALTAPKAIGRPCGT